MDDHAHINNQIRSDMYPLPRQIEAGIEAESVTASELFAAVVRWIHHDVADDDLAQLSRDLVVDEQRGRSPLWAARRFPDGSLAAACYFRRLPGNVATLGGARQAQSSVSEKPSDLSECLAACLRRGAALGIGQIQAILPETDGKLRRSLESAGFFAAAIVEQRCLRLDAPQLTVHAIATQEQPPTPAARPRSSASARESRSAGCPPAIER
ncbi:MAG: hypothetical protein KatS3mg111_0938 [Pirellulaceae bacterium]|nr:MAG: hypothetical protein KatS3mg111_0938 [Pirellulaceae bacterium]